jgi:predicted GNAT family acetyltransferase
VLRRIVDAEPARHVHTAATLHTARRRSQRLLALVEGDRVLGALHSLRGFAWALERERREDPAVLGALADLIGARAASPEVVVGPTAEIERVVETLELRGLRPLELRQQVMMAFSDPRGSVPAARQTSLRMRPAGLRDVPWLLEAHAAMCREDLGVDQVARNRSGYERYFQELVSGKRAWIGEDEAGPVFKAEVAVVSRDAWLVEGVYTVDRARGRGHAKAGMIDLCGRAAGQGRLTCLYVHVVNEPALAVYRRVGFQPVCPWTTALLRRR